MDLKYFRKNLILIMRRRNLNYKSVAQLCDLTATCILNFINGERLQPTVETVFKLMDGLDVSFDDLFCHPDRHLKKNVDIFLNPNTNPQWPLQRQGRVCLP